MFNINNKQPYLHKDCNTTLDNPRQFILSSRERIKLLVDEDSFQESDIDLCSCNPLNFPKYEEKLKNAAMQTSLTEAIVTGSASIGGIRVELGVMESSFMIGSMGSVVGEKVCRTIERAIDAKCPMIVCISSGGARLQEGLISLMQMAKTSTALTRFQRLKLLFISILMHPTAGGVLASFASLADIIIAEPDALIGFMGSRAVNNTNEQQIHEDFNRSESVFKRGMIDLLVDNAQMRQTLMLLLKLHVGGVYDLHTINS